MPRGVPLGRSWLLLFGAIPLGKVDIRLAELELGRRFVERSSLAVMKEWQHERTLEPTDAGCVVRDTLTFEMREPLSRVPGAERVMRGLVTLLFHHRHGSLGRRHSGSGDGARTTSTTR